MTGKQIRWLIVLIPFLIGLIASIIVMVGGYQQGQGQGSQVWQTARPYVYLFIFLLVFEFATYKAHLHNIYINGFGVVALAFLDWYFFGLPLEILILFIIPITALMVLRINPFQYIDRNRGGQDEGP